MQSMTCQTCARHERSLFYAIAYGGTLVLWMFVTAGAGHGTFVPIAISSAPLSLLGLPAACVGAPVWWGITGYVVDGSARSRRVYLAMMIVHYVTMPLLVAYTLVGPADDLPSFMAYLARPDTLVMLLAGFANYVAGQCLLWRAFWHRR